jgi:ankyrin repeat protein
MKSDHGRGISQRCACLVTVFCVLCLAIPTAVYAGKLEDSLIAAAKRGKVKQVRAALSKGVDIEAKDDEFGSTSLIWATYYGHKGVVELLLERGAKVDATNKEGRSALIFAAGINRPEVAVLLLGGGANPGLKDGEGRTALDWARRKGNRQVLSLLNAHDDKAISRAKKAEQDLMESARSGNVKRLKDLLDAGADPNTRDRAGQTPLFVASETGHKEAVNLLLERGAAPTNRYGYLLRACGNGHKELVRVLLESGAVADVCNEEGYTPLTLAAKGGHTEVAELLVKSGVPFHSKDYKGRSALTTACVNDRTHFTEHFLEMEPTSPGANSRVDEAVIEAADQGAPECVAILLKHGAAVDTKDADGETPLMKACQKGHTSVARILLERGANVNTCNKDGVSIITLAGLHGTQDVVKLLLKSGADPKDTIQSIHSEMLKAAKAGRWHDVEKLLRKGAGAAPTKERGMTVIDLALEDGEWSWGKRLIQSTLTIQSKDPHKAEAGRKLLEAAAKLNVEYVKKLIADGADVNFRDEKGRTPLHLAVDRHLSWGSAAVAKLLIENGAHVNARDMTSHTPPMDLASCMVREPLNYHHLMRILLESGASAASVKSALFSAHRFRNNKQAIDLLGKFSPEEEAECKQSIEQQEAVSGKDHFLVAPHLMKLAEVYLHRKQYSGAEPILKRCVMIL